MWSLIPLHSFNFLHPNCNLHQLLSFAPEFFFKTTFYRYLDLLLFSASFSFLSLFSFAVLSVFTGNGLGCLKLLLGSSP